MDAAAGYLLARVAQLKGENEQLRRELAALRPGAPGAAARGGGGGDEQDEHVSRQVLKAAEEVSAGLILPPGRRPDLDIRGTNLLKALRAGNVEKVGALVAADPSLLQMRCLSSRELLSFTPLHVAAYDGKTELVDRLLALGADPQRTDLLGRTPLHLAAMRLHAGVVATLLPRMDGAKGERAPRDAGGSTPAALAALNDKGWADKRQVFAMVHERGDRCISPLVRRHGSSGATPGSRQRPPPQAHGPGQPGQQPPPAPRSALRNGGSVLRELTMQRAAHAAFAAVRCGSFEMPGKRVLMEDAVVCEPELLSGLALFAVLDGHGGSGAAQFCKNGLAAALLERPEVRSAAALGRGEAAGEALKAALRGALLALDEVMRRSPAFALREKKEGDKVRMVATEESGTTAVVLAVTLAFVAVANVGDSRALVLGPRGDLVLATVDQRSDRDPSDGFWDQECRRVEAAGGVVLAGGRVATSAASDAPSLAISRALGDVEFKQLKHLPPESQVVSPEPELYLVPRAERPLTCVLACDGIWDVLKNDEVARLVHSADASQSLDDVAQAVVMESFDRDSPDNLSVVVVRLEAPDALEAASGAMRGLSLQQPPQQSQQQLDEEAVRRNLLADIDTLV